MLRLLTVNSFRLVLVFSVTLLGGVTVSRTAEAWCRSTTCRGGPEKCPVDENGCPSKGKKIMWPTSCVGYNLQQDGTARLDMRDVRVVIGKSFSAWSEVTCKDGKKANFAYGELQDVACNEALYNKTGSNVNVVFFRDNEWKYSGIDGTLATTTVTFNDESGEIYDADIAINAAYNQLTVSDTAPNYDLQSIITHEAGHFLGMAHSSDPEAVMNASYQPRTISLRDLTEDDMEGVCDAYPPTRKARCDMTPRGGLATTCEIDEEANFLGCEAAGASPSAAKKTASIAALASVIGAFAVGIMSRRRRGRRAP